jgi:hypothetical protein
MPKLIQDTGNVRRIAALQQASRKAAINRSNQEHAMARAKRRQHYSGEDGESEIEMESGREEMEHEADEGIGMTRRSLRRMQRNPLDPLDLFNGPMARMMDQNWSMFQKMMHAMREESLHFVNRRLEHTSHAIESSRDCEGISDLLVLQQEWMIDFARDYAEQTKRFAELMRDLAEDGSASLSRISSESAERGRSVSEEEERRAA